MSDEPMFGIIDTTVNAWMGTKDGPTLHADRDLACAAATILTEMFLAEPTRFEVRQFDEKGLVMRDEVTAHMTTHHAIRRIERRAKKGDT